jgi:hypothetical protein
VYSAFSSVNLYAPTKATNLNGSHVTHVITRGRGGRGHNVAVGLDQTDLNDRFDSVRGPSNAETAIDFTFAPRVELQRLLERVLRLWGLD